MRKSILLMITVAIAVLGCNQRNGPNTVGNSTVNYDHAVSPVTGAKAILTIYFTPSISPNHSMDSELAMALFSDGAAALSKADHGHGPPYVYGQVSASKMDVLTGLLESIRKLHMKDQAYTGPDSAYTTIVLSSVSGRSYLCLESWHEQHEGTGRVVVSNIGLEHLDGRSAEEIRSHWSKDYKEFRKQWDRLRHTVMESDLQDRKVIYETIHLEN